MLVYLVRTVTPSPLPRMTAGYASRRETMAIGSGDCFSGFPAGKIVLQQVPKSLIALQQLEIKHNVVVLWEMSVWLTSIRPFATPSTHRPGYCC